MGKHLVVVGAGHAHLTVLKNLEEFKQSGHRVTVVSASSLHYYSGMGPGMLSGIYRPEEIRFNVRKMSEDRGAAFVEDNVVNIRPREKKIDLQSGDEMSYDVLSLNTGSFVPAMGAMTDEYVFTVKPIEKLLLARRRILEDLKDKDLTLTVVGGGPTGVEVAGNLERLAKNESSRCRITLVAGRRLLSEFKSSVRKRALQSLTSRHIQVIEGARVSDVKDRRVQLSNGDVLDADYVFMAVGVKPSSLFIDSGLPTGTDGGMLVNKFLQSVEYPELFGGGDCISFEPQPLAKVGVYAVRQNPILFHNLLGILNGGTLQEFNPQGTFLLALNMGDGTAVVRWHFVVWGGPLGFTLKDYIDRKFMGHFQVSGEVGD
ncbi:MAG: FAD-dependent oxidoreductase [Deltaproteobacteria bacterium]|nr:FAD-dependent oxidoreductase [Deltaproteobacteria bacterium]